MCLLLYWTLILIIKKNLDITDIGNYLKYIKIIKTDVIIY